jgi:hypothetical protein
VTWVPIRRATGPAIGATAAIISAIGTNAAPASVGEKPSTFCRYIAVKK